MEISLVTLVIISGHAFSAGVIFTMLCDSSKKISSSRAKATGRKEEQDATPKHETRG